MRLTGHLVWLIGCLLALAIGLLAATSGYPRSASAVASPCPPQINGQWTGTWTSTAPPFPLADGGSWQADLTISAGTIQGTITIAGTLNATDEPVSGTISCNQITYGTIGNTIAFTGILSADGTTDSGTYSASTGDYGTWQGATSHLGIITTVAGNGTAGFSGDGGPATSAELNYPNGVALDGAGNLYIADGPNCRVREVSAGIITTVAGTGTCGFSGDGGPATSADIGNPMGVAVDASGNLYFADGNCRVREVSGGIITTVAGNGGCGVSSGDGGPATSATLGFPDGLALDAAGNLYVAINTLTVYANDCRVREVSGGIITTVAGNGGCYGVGDGGPATNAQLHSPYGVATDRTGHLYIAEDCRVREVNAGIIITVAGGGGCAYGGDGGPATSAGLVRPYGMATDGTGNLFIADVADSRVREVFAATPSVGSIMAHVFEDHDADQLQTAGEPNLSAWTLELFTGPDCTSISNASSTTDSDGNATFNELVAGQYSVEEIVQPGWTALTALTSICQNVGVTAASVSAVNFANAPEFEILGPHAWETSLAADPTNDRHVVVGFNEFLSDGSTQCGWAETIDGGGSWTSGTLSLPTGFKPLGDPWVRFSSDGQQLFYSCLGQTPFVAVSARAFVTLSRSEESIFLAHATRSCASNGCMARPQDFAAPTTGTIATATSTQTCILRSSICRTRQDFFDHPAVAISRNGSGGARVIACWTDNAGGSGLPLTQSVRIAYSDDLVHWPVTRVVPDAQYCAAGGGPAEVGVTWESVSHQDLEVTTSPDGMTWSSAQPLHAVGSLVGACKSPSGATVACSTTSRVLSVPYALLMTNGNGLRAIYEVAVAGRSQVYVADSADNWIARAIGDPGSEQFLPGAGTCSGVVGMYESNPNTSATYRYTVWSVDGAGVPRRMYESSVAVSGGDLPGGDILTPRIGDYTGVDCSGTSVFSAWADNRTGVPAIYGARLSLPKLDQPSQLIFTTEPSVSGLAGVAFATEPVVQIADAGGNAVTADNTSTVTLSLNTLSGGPGVLVCTTNPLTVVAGVAAFSGCSISAPGTYTLTATSSVGGVTTATSSEIVIS